MDRPRGRRRRPARPRHEPVHRPGAQPHRARARVGAGAGWPATRPTPASTPRSPTGRCPTPTTRRSPRSSPTGRPGSFTWVPEACGGAGGWVWTTFCAYQWDLDYTEPRGVRWRCSARSPGWPTAASTSSGWTPSRSCGSGWAPTARTSRRRTGCCRLLHALTRLAAPGVDLQGRGDRLARGPGAVPRRRTSGTGRSASWPTTTSSWCCSGAALADPGRPAGRPRAAAGCAPIPPTTSWVTYVRGHDDIGWAVSDADAAAVGLGGFAHRRFLNDFYAGASRAPSRAGRCSRRTRRPATPGSRAPRPRSCGIEEALERGDDVALDAGIRRLRAALLGRVLLRRHPAALHGRRAGAAQRRRLPRRPRAGRRTTAGCTARRWTGRRPRGGSDPATLEGRVFARLQRLGEARRALPALRGGGECTVLDVGNDAVLAWRRRHPRSGTLRRAWPTSAGPPQTVDADTVTGFGTFEPVLTSDGPPELRADRVLLPGPRIRLVRRALRVRGRGNGAPPRRPYRQPAADHQPTPRPGKPVATTTSPLRAQERAW